MSAKKTREADTKIIERLSKLSRSATSRELLMRKTCW